MAALEGGLGVDYNNHATRCRNWARPQRLLGGDAVGRGRSWARPQLGEAARLPQVGFSEAVDSMDRCRVPAWRRSSALGASRSALLEGGRRHRGWQEAGEPLHERDLCPQALRHSKAGLVFVIIFSSTKITFATRQHSCDALHECVSRRLGTRCWGWMVPKHRRGRVG